MFIKFLESKGWILISYYIKYYKLVNNLYKCSILWKKFNFVFENKYKNYKIKKY